MRLGTSLGLASIVGLQWSLLFFWLVADDRPPAWDSAWHAMLSLDAYRQLSGTAEMPTSRVGAVYPLFAYAAGVYPRFVHLVSTPMVGLFGEDYDGALATNAIFLLVLVASAYRLGAATAGSRGGGLLLAFVTSTIPAYGALMRQFLLDFPLVAMTAAALAVLGDPPRTRFAAAAVGVILGLGMLTKWSFALFVAVPLVAMLAKTFTRADGGRHVLLVLLTCVAISAVWYDPRTIQAALPVLAQNLTSQGPMEGDPPVFATASLFYYGAALWRGYSPLYAALTLVALGVLVVDRTPQRRWLSFLVSGGVIYGVFTLVPNKEPRYVAPLFLFPSVVLVAGLLAIRNERRRILAIAFTVLAGLVQNLAFLSGRGSTVEIAGVLVADLRGRAPARPPRLDEEILARIHERAGDKPFSLCVASENAIVNDVTLSYTAFRKRYPVTRMGPGGCDPRDHDYTVVGPILPTWRAGAFLESKRRVEEAPAAFEKWFVDETYSLYANRR